jgi:hypothetical protein
MPRSLVWSKLTGVSRRLLFPDDVDDDESRRVRVRGHMEDQREWKLTLTAVAVNAT